MKVPSEIRSEGMERWDTILRGLKQRRIIVFHRGMSTNQQADESDCLDQRRAHHRTKEAMGNTVHSEIETKE